MPDFKELYSGEEFEQRVSIQQKYSSVNLPEWLSSLYGFRDGCRVLDLGCGNGKDLLYFSPFIGKGLGIDSSENLIRKASEKKLEGNVDNIEFACADCNAFLQAKDRFDIIYSNFAFYYFNQAQVLENIFTMLHPQGAVYIGGSPEENAPELSLLINELLKEDEVPLTYKKGFSDVRKYLGLFKKHFAFVDFYRFKNIISFPSVIYFLQYLENTTLLQSLSPEKRDFFLKESRVILHRTNNFNLTKVVDILRASNKHEE